MGAWKVDVLVVVVVVVVLVVVVYAKQTCEKRQGRRTELYNVQFIHLTKGDAGCYVMGKEITLLQQSL